MAKKKTAKTYLVKWSMRCCPFGGYLPSECAGTLRVDASEVEAMSDEEREAHFQKMVDEEVRMNGPLGAVDSVDEVKK